jgi:hypothetical protein
MRKFENVDIVAALGAIVELNTEHYKSDFKYDIKQFKEAAKNIDGENNRFLWLSRPSGTQCYSERDVYIKDTTAFNTWNYYATITGKDTPFSNVIVNDRVLTYAVEVKGIENGRIKGDLCELDYRNHVKQLNRVALPLHTVTATYKDGATFTLPPKEHEEKHMQRHHQHGQLQTLVYNSKNADSLQAVLKSEREQREKAARPAKFKIGVKNQKQPSIKQQLAKDKKQLAAKRTTTPQKTAIKNKNTGLGD